MHVMFEVYLAPGATGEGMFTQETLDDTMAQMMTPEQAKAVGFDGLPEPPEGVNSVFIVVAKRDERRILNVLERSPDAAKFRMHEVSIDL